MKIKIDNKKCQKLNDCLKCVQICPAKVFVLKPKREKDSLYGGSFEIIALFKDMCNGCMKCIEICPEQCLHIEF